MTLENPNDQNPGNRPEHDQGPPDLDEILKKLAGTFRRDPKKQSNANNSSSKSAKKSPFGSFKKINPRSAWPFLFGFLGVFSAIWVVSGVFVVQPAERAVILRFGKYVETVGPGPHWYPPLIESAIRLNVDQVLSRDLSGVMLTENENMVYVQFAVQYRISNIQEYLFNVVNPEETLDESMDSAVRQVIGRSQLNQILTTGRDQIAENVRQELILLMSKYHTGIEVVDVTMQPAKAPDQVKDAFDDVIKAREDQARVANEAMSYANNVVPVATGKAARLVQEANAEASRMVFDAKANVAAFNALLPAHQMSPTVTDQRLYFETMEQVLGSHSVVVSEKGNFFSFPSKGSANITQAMLPAHPMAGSTSTASSQDVQSGDSQDTSSPEAVALKKAAYVRWQEAQSNET